MLPLLIFNTAIVTTSPEYEEEHVFSYWKLTLKEAATMAQTAHAAGAIRSHCGHEGTAQVLTELLGVLIKVDRAPAEQQIGQSAIVLKLRKRLPEGRILTREEMEEIGYDLLLLTRHPVRRVCAISPEGGNAVGYIEETTEPYGERAVMLDRI